jgi:hypothetical protein
MRRELAAAIRVRVADLDVSVMTATSNAKKILIHWDSKCRVLYQGIIFHKG